MKDAADLQSNAPIHCTGRLCPPHPPPSCALRALCSARKAPATPDHTLTCPIRAPTGVRALISRSCPTWAERFGVYSVPHVFLFPNAARTQSSTLQGKPLPVVGSQLCLLPPPSPTRQSHHHSPSSKSGRRFSTRRLLRRLCPRSRRMRQHALCDGQTSRRRTPTNKSLQMARVRGRRSARMSACHRLLETRARHRLRRRCDCHPLRGKRCCSHRFPDSSITPRPE